MDRLFIALTKEVFYFIGKFARFFLALLVIFIVWVVYMVQTADQRAIARECREYHKLGKYNKVFANELHWYRTEVWLDEQCKDWGK